MIDLKSKRIGETRLNTFGSEMTIIDYSGKENTLVEFKESGYKVKISYSTFKTGKIKNPYDKTVYNIGFLGEGKYVPSIRLHDHNAKWKHTSEYNTWINMLERCYSKDSKDKFPSYIGCLVCEEWHNFQVFAKWYEDNYYQIEGHVMNIDKDILIKGNKIYSPDTCVIVPSNINTLFVKRSGYRGNYPIGVFKEGDKFAVNCKNHKENRIRLGVYETPKEAFGVYKTYKETVIKQVAEEYKDKIPKKLYDAMYKYIVEITD